MMGRMKVKVRRGYQLDEVAGERTYFFDTWHQ